MNDTDERPAGAGADVNANVRALCARHQVTHEDIAHAANISLSTWHRRMASPVGGSAWTVAQLQQVANALGVDTASLLERH